MVPQRGREKTNREADRMEWQKEVMGTANGKRGEAGLWGRARCGLKEPSPGGQVYPAHLPPPYLHPIPQGRASGAHQHPRGQQRPAACPAPPAVIPSPQGPHAALVAPTAPMLPWWGREMATLSPRGGGRALGARSRLWAAPTESYFLQQLGQGSIKNSSQEHRRDRGRSCEPAPESVCAPRTGRARILGCLNKGIVC